MSQVIHLVNRNIIKLVVKHVVFSMKKMIKILY